ncbi:hypothetical protein ACNUDN_29470 [Mycobacterium sp. smrl_JER01]|uniref:hypothetical protein n=1 Tax=unclassified Mycobacterium TaxID=2642494 RepID=UPI00059F9974|nr:hypothetical protein [Mycobacterium sp. shizuoka-1]GAY15830.1 hypothetical protein MSZK_25560 [Mycobacterium sp. shizuoka-1]
MTTTLDTAPGEVAADVPSTRQQKTRRGTETRKRSAQMALRLLPREADVAAAVAAGFNKKSVQELIVEACQPLMSPEALVTLAEDRESVRALAREHGISEVQALLLRALTSTPTAVA